jgi:hypothetical protein
MPAGVSVAVAMIAPQMSLRLVRPPIAGADGRRPVCPTPMMSGSYFQRVTPPSTRRGDHPISRGAAAQRGVPPGPL